MSTEVSHQYKNKVFLKGQFKQSALKLCRFLNILPSDGSTFLRQKDQDFEMSTKVTVDELENICEIGTTVSRLDFHYNYNIISLSYKSYSNALNVLFVINGDIKYSEKFIFFVENILEITRLTEEISELTDGHRQATPDISTVEESEVVISKEAINKRQFLEIDKSVFKLMKQVYERETENTVGWTFEKYLHQVIQAHCQDIMGYNQ